MNEDAPNSSAAEQRNVFRRRIVILHLLKKAPAVPLPEISQCGRTTSGGRGARSSSYGLRLGGTLLNPRVKLRTIQAGVSGGDRGSSTPRVRSARRSSYRGHRVRYRISLPYLSRCRLFCSRSGTEPRDARGRR